MSGLSLSQATEKVQSFALSGMSEQKVYEAYDEWAKEGTYDELMAAVRSRGPEILAQVFAEVYPESNRDISILDVAAGTGRGAEELRKVSFTNIAALDPSSEMLEIAKEKNIYNRFICSPIGYDPVDIEEGTFDAVSCVGGLAEGHLPASSVIEMVRLIKRGGKVILVSNASTWETLPEYKVKMAAILEKLQSDGEVRLIKKEVREGYRMKTEKECASAIIIVLEKLI